MTITENQTVSEVAALSIQAVRTFERHNIDYCCGGKRPLGEVCRDRRLEPGVLIAELNAALAEAKSEDRDWNTAPLTELVAHINHKHHEYLKAELPRISARLAKVMKVYGVQDVATLATLPKVYEGLRAVRGVSGHSILVAVPFMPVSHHSTRNLISSRAPHAAHASRAPRSSCDPFIV